MPSEIPLYRPDITESDIAAVAAAMGGLMQGRVVEEFELACAQRCGREAGVAVSSGTAALHCALASLGIGPGDEVVTTPFSAAATVNAILYLQARPVFVDIDPKTLTVDAAKLEGALTPRTRGILALDVFGHPDGMAEVEKVAGRHELPLIEDACTGLGAKWKTRPVGSFGRVSILSFSESGVVTTGEGGMVLTDDQRLADACRSLRNQGRDNPAWMVHTRMGYSYRLSDLNAALGLSQVGRLEASLEQRRRVARDYFEALMVSRYVTLPTLEQETTLSWSTLVVRLNDLFETSDEIIRRLRAEGIGCGMPYPALHLQPYVASLLKSAPSDFPVCEYVASHTLALPFHARLTTAEVGRVCSSLERIAQSVLTSQSDRMRP